MASHGHGLHPTLFVVALVLLPSLIEPMREQAHSNMEVSDNKQVIKCVSGVHTYINLGDGGCFQHIDSEGKFVNNSEVIYKSKFCPFPGTSSAQERKLLFTWYTKTLSERRQPFSVNDMTMACLISDVKDLYWGFKSKLNFKGTNEAFCDTMLSLPLMFESIGFDGPGLVLEDNRTFSTWTYNTQSQYGLGPKRIGPGKGCNAITSKNLGEVRFGRLALRVVLPSYYLHRYAESGTGMVMLGGASLLNPFTTFTSDHFTTQAGHICSTLAFASEGNLDDVFSLNSIKNGKLYSQAILDRDKNECSSAAPCNYVANTSLHLGACDICPIDAWFDRSTGGCYREAGRYGGRTQCSGNSEKKTCECHKAICWYFTADFAAAMEAITKSC